MPTSPSRQVTKQPRDPSKTPHPSGACPFFTRPKAPRLLHKPMIMSQLNLCPKKVEISGLMRPSPLVNPGTLTTRLSHNPQPTSHTPNSDAPFPFLRHPQPFFTANPLIMSSLPLCVNKRTLCV